MISCCSWVLSRCRCFPRDQCRLTCESHTLVSLDVRVARGLRQNDFGGTSLFFEIPPLGLLLFSVRQILQLQNPQRPSTPIL
jgi:hypothetical protein